MEVMNHFEVGEALQRLKEDARQIAYRLTLCFRHEDAIVETIMSTADYANLRKHSADIVLKEVLEVSVEPGRQQALTGLAEQNEETEALRLQAESQKAERVKLESLSEALRQKEEELEERAVLVEARRRSLLKWRWLRFAQGVAVVCCAGAVMLPPFVDIWFAHESTDEAMVRRAALLARYETTIRKREANVSTVENSMKFIGVTITNNGPDYVQLRIGDHNSNISASMNEELSLPA